MTALEYCVRMSSSYTHSHSAIFTHAHTHTNFHISTHSDSHSYNPTLAPDTRIQTKVPSPVHICCRRNHPAAMKELLRVADVHCLDLDSQTPLHVAARMWHVNCVRTLLACKASPNGLPSTATDSPDAPTPLEIVTLQHKWPAVVVALLAGGADPNTVQAKSQNNDEPQERQDRLLSRVIARGDEELCQIYVENGSFAVDKTLSTNGLTALQHAIYTNKLGIIQLLARLGGGVNVSVRTANAHPLAQYSPVVAAACCGKIDILVELLEFGGDEAEANRALLPHGITCSQLQSVPWPPAQTDAAKSLVADMHRAFSEELGHLPKRVTRSEFLAWIQNARSGALEHMFGSKMFKAFVDMELLGEARSTRNAIELPMVDSTRNLLVFFKTPGVYLRVESHLVLVISTSFDSCSHAKSSPISCRFLLEMAERYHFLFLAPFLAQCKSQRTANI